MSDDDALSRTNRFLTVRKSTEVARTGDDDIDALLGEVEQSTRPKPVAPKPPLAAPAPKPAPEPVRNPLAVAAPSTRPAVAVQSQTPGVTAEVLPPASPPQDGSGGTQNITVVVNTPAPVVAPYPWWGGWWGYPYYPATCPACHGRPYHCGRWRCPY